MAAVRLLLLLILMSFTAIASAAHASDGITSRSWGGGMSYTGWLPLRVEFGPAGTGSVYPDGATAAQALHDVRINGNAIHFEWREESGTTRFDGSLAPGGDALSGTIKQGQRTGIFHLAPVMPFDAASFEPLVGIYQFKPGEFLWIGRVSELRRQPSFVDASTGRLGTLYKSSGTEYFSGAAMMSPLPRGPKFSFVMKGGRVAAVRVQEASGKVRTAKRLNAYREEPVTFANKDISLAGTAVVPTKRGRHPAVVFLHGSGPASRYYFSAMPYLLAAHGVASLAYDKRGVGGSTGDRHKSTFEDLADDALAGLRLLQSRPDIDGRRIGIFGHSQGGWTGPLAASRSPDVRFVVMSAGAAVSVDQQILDQKRRNLRSAGFAPDEIEAVLDHLRLHFAVRDKREDFAKLERSYAAAQGKKWADQLWKPNRETISIRSEVYEPEPVLRRLRTPLLALFGGNDENVHPDDNLERLRRYQAAAGNQRSEIKVFPGADHDLLIGGTLRRERTQYAPGYLQTVIGWIKAQASAAGDSKAKRIALPSGGAAVHDVRALLLHTRGRSLRCLNVSEHRRRASAGPSWCRPPSRTRPA